MKGIITGDIIDSSFIPAEQRTNFLDSFSCVIEELRPFSPLKYDFFRGDSFQVVVERPEEAMPVAVLLRAGLKSCTPEGLDHIWDARVAVGIGDVDFLSDRVIVSDGEAFRLSGREFDELGKKNLAIRTPWTDVDEELKVSTAFVDDIMTNWTSNQSSAVYMLLACGMTQKMIADELGQTFQNVSKLLIAAKEKLISAYLTRFKRLIISKL